MIIGDLYEHPANSIERDVALLRVYIPLCREWGTRSVVPPTTTMPHIKSRFALPPPIPDENAHYAVFGEPGQVYPSDFTAQIDAISGRTRSLYGLRQAVLEGATALAAPVSAGGLGLDAAAGHMVGIYSHNCIVSTSFL